jgi:diguanylate cyclase (GGDEF)-like protein/PAS domain S-box-containing protein
MRHLLSKYVLAVVAVTVALTGILLLALLAEQTSLTSAVLDGRRQLLVEQRRDRIVESANEILAAASTPQQHTLLDSLGIVTVRLDDLALIEPTPSGNENSAERLTLAIPDNQQVQIEFRTDDIDTAVAAYGETLDAKFGPLHSQALQGHLWGALVILALGLAIAWYAANHMVKPLRRLAAQAARIGSGDFAQGYDVNDRQDELGDLGRAFETMRKRLQDTTVRRDYLDKILASMNEAVIVTDPAGKIQHLNHAANQMLEYGPTDLEGSDFTRVVAIDARRGAEFQVPQHNPKESVFTTAGGQNIPVSYTSSTLMDDDGEIMGRIFAAQNISGRKKAEQRIRYLARVDPLTKLPNRMQFQHLLQQSMARARKSDQYLALMYLDIDHFKDINDTFGHAAGDTCLEHIAERLNAQLPETATAGRLAGDEFAVIIGGFDQMDELSAQLRNTTRELLEAIGEPFTVLDQEIFVTASIGIAVHPNDADNVIDIIRNADAALYQAKKNGGNCFEFYSPDMKTAAVERLMLKSKLRRAFEREELRLHYQPKYNVQTGQIEGAEALVRWDVPDRGLIYPGDFIPLAEETNLILQIGEWVLNRVCSDYRAWQRSLPSPGRVAVNLSLRQLRQRSFLERVADIFHSNGVSPTCLEFEITETTLMEDTERTIRTLDALYGMGLSLSIDDFGTGYSSLSALQQFPISTLKIDQSFVRDIPLDEDDCMIVSTIIKMGRGLNMEVVAEGVESEQQLEFLRRNNCHFAQGHLFGEPLNADAYLELLVQEAAGVNRFGALFA